MSHINRFLVFIIIVNITCFAQDNNGVININSNYGHSISKRASGFNVRIADKIWSYSHPEFKEVVKELKPGWLRYFSGTMGDAFCSATGQYNLDYISMFDHTEAFLRGYRFLEKKGAHRIVDLYDLLREVNGKLVVTINGFAETPQMTLELARFCKNNHIEVETWQFCNEPYFYVPNRNRYWWNNGYDYAAKMKPHAEAIKQIFPEAKLALNYTWDGVWTFMKEINEFQQKKETYWNVFSKHSYAPHTGKKETLEKAYKRANTKLLEATSDQAMKDIEAYTWKDVPMLITEFGVWNKPLNGVYESIYNIEYTMRQLEHTNTELVGVHEISSKYSPLKKQNEIIENTFQYDLEIDTDTVLSGIKRKLEGKAYRMFHEATNNSDYLYNTTVENIIEVPGLKNTRVNGMFVQTYRGTNGFNYIVITNRSGKSRDFQVKVDGKNLNKDLETNYFSGISLAHKNADVHQQVFKKGLLNIKPYSVSVSKWEKGGYTLEEPRIYKATVEKEGVLLKWGQIPNAEKYKIYYSSKSTGLEEFVVVDNEDHVLIQDLLPNEQYFFTIVAMNGNSVSPLSKKISVSYQLPDQTKIFKVSRRDNTVTLFWQSVLNANSYLISYVDDYGKNIKINTGNVYGYKIKNLNNQKTYNFRVTAYNGLGKGKASKEKSVLVSTKVPYSPRNVSASKISKNTIEVKWVPQKEVFENTLYNVYRGEKLHEFTKIASNLKDTIYIDQNIKEGIQYYYTVKSETEVGESNFYPNIATTFPLGNQNQINIQYIQRNKEGYLVRVNMNKTSLSIDDSYGVIVNNISYLNVEHTKVLGMKNKQMKNSFEVFIPYTSLKEKSNYAIKAFIIGKDHNIESNTVNQYFSGK